MLEIKKWEDQGKSQINFYTVKSDMDQMATDLAYEMSLRELT